MCKQPQAPTENILVGQATKPAPQRAKIITPRANNTYTLSQGGVAAQQKKPAEKPAVKPAAKPTAKKRSASDIVGVKPDAVKERAVAKPAIKAAPAKPKKSAPMPGRKFLLKTKKRNPLPEEQTQQLAESVILGFTSRLTEVAIAKGGYISVQDLEVLNKKFEQQTHQLKGVLDKSFEDYVTARENASWSQSRKYPFDRMIVKTFSNMLEDDSRKLRAADSVSRRMLPGFFMALPMILGADKLEGYQGKCRAVVKLVKKAYGDKFEWEDVYESDDARAIVIDSLIDIARIFEDIEKRGEWFIDMANSHLPPPDDDTTLTEAEWTFTADGFRKFFKAIMSDQSDALDSEGGRLLITRRHGVEETVELVEMMKSLFAGLKVLYAEAPERSSFRASAIKKASSRDCFALRRGSQWV